MRKPWSKTGSTKPEERVWASKSEAALGGEAGDGKDHNLQYWIDSGFLTMPRHDSHNPPEGGPPQ